MLPRSARRRPSSSILALSLLLAAACAAPAPGPPEGGGGGAGGAPLSPPAGRDGALGGETGASAPAPGRGGAGGAGPAAAPADAGGRGAGDAAGGAGGDARAPGATTADAGGGAAADAAAGRPAGPGDGGGGFHDPCPPRGTPCKIMPVGDSITMIPGYRVALFRKAKNAGRSITFVGSLSGGPATVDGAPFPAQHEGHNGHDVDGVHRLVEPPLMTYKPHVVLLMIGTNDAHRSPQVATAPARVGAMVDTIVQQVPDALVVVAKIVPTREDPASMYYRAGHDERIRAFNDALGPVLEARRRQGKHVVTVDMYAAFTANPAYKTAYMAENLHPTTAGFGVMADVWWAAIEPALK